MQDQSKLTNIFLNSLIDGCTGAALFGRLRWFGAPKRLIDPRSVADYSRSQDARDDARVQELLRVSPQKPLINQSSQELHPGNVS